MSFQKAASLLDFNFKKVQKNNERLYITETNQNELWNLYLDSFPKGENNIYKTNREYDCNCCKNFIRDIGSIVYLDNKLNMYSIWDVDVEYPFNVVFSALSDYVKSKKIKSVFLTNKTKFGSEVTISNDHIKYNHFHCSINRVYVTDKVATVLSTYKGKYDVFKRGLNELTIDSINTVLELISKNNLYRGFQYKDLLSQFKELKTSYDKLPANKKDLFIWKNVLSSASNIKNTMIGTLLEDLSSGKSTISAVLSYENKAENYNRTTAVVTQSMAELAYKTISDLGYEPSLHRRIATIYDVNINDVLWVNPNKSTLLKSGDLKNVMLGLTSNKKFNDRVSEEVEIEEFTKKILTKAKSIEYFFDDKDTSHLVALTTAQNDDDKKMFKWDNHFAWSYKGGVTDVIKERVKKEGGRLTGELRVSLIWHNTDDLDLHAITPSNEHVYYSLKYIKYQNKPVLDIDKNYSSSDLTNTPVENMVFDKLEDGIYTFKVHNFNKRESSNVGFSIQVAYKDNEKNYTFDRDVLDNNKLDILEVKVVNKQVVAVNVINKNLIDTGVNSNNEIWGLKTNTFVPVDFFMLSPNYWGDNKIGNKHYLFMLSNAEVSENIKGFYNEFLNSDLYTHRKVFEMLSDKIMCEKSKGLCGVGFSSTLNKVATFKVDGKVLKVKFN